MDCSMPDSSVHGISQARVLEQITISFSRGIFLTQGLNQCLLLWQADSLPLSHLGRPSPSLGLPQMQLSFDKMENYINFIKFGKRSIFK